MTPSPRPLHVAVSSAVLATETTVGIAFRHFLGKSQMAWSGRAGDRNAAVWTRLGKFMMGSIGALAVGDLREPSEVPARLAADLVAQGVVSIASTTLRDSRGITCIAVLDSRPRDFEPAIGELLEGILRRT